MAEKFTYATIREINGHTLKRLLGYPNRCRLEGMIRDLSESERLTLAQFEAAVEVLNRLGALDPKKLEEILPQPFTAGHEVLDEGIVGHTFTPQKK